MIFCEYAAPMPGSTSSCSLVAELMSTRSALAADEACDEAVACLLAGFDCPLPADTKKMNARASDVAVDKIRFPVMTILLYCGFFSFLAGWYPSFTASSSDIYFPFFVFP
jgi:hypothetical protein